MRPLNTMKLSFLIGLLSLTFIFQSFGQRVDNNAAVNLGTTVTNIAASTTNSTAGAIIPIYSSPIRLYLTGTGNAATTNGALTVYFSTASGHSYLTNNFDTARLSNIKLTISNSINGATVTVSDWFVVSGASYIRPGIIENTFLGSVSNIAINVGYTKD